MFCNPDGTPSDPSQASNVEVEPPDTVIVFVGTPKSAARKITVTEIFTELDVSICRSDIAYLKLSEPGLDTHTPIRREPPRLVDTVSVTGWGYTSDSDRSKLPDTRFTIEKPITNTGPGSMPADAFAIGGNSMCLGDSGASALREGALLGVYSRIDDAGACELELNRNIFVWAGAHLPLAEKAFAAAGQTPWYEGERPPWLAKAGAACTKDEGCMSSRCEAGTCVAPCGAAGLACPAGKTCGADQTCVDPVVETPVAPPPEEDSGCSTSGARTNGSALVLAAIVAVVAAIGKRRRSRH